MARDPFRINAEPEIGKTEVLYRGSGSELEKLTSQLDGVKSSDVYPSFESDFKSTVYFYRADDGFRSKLFQLCKESLPEPHHESERRTRIFFKWGVVAVVCLLGAYLLFNLINSIGYLLRVIKMVG